MLNAAAFPKKRGGDSFTPDFAKLEVTRNQRGQLALALMEVLGSQNGPTTRSTGDVDRLVQCIATVGMTFHDLHGRQHHRQRHGGEDKSNDFQSSAVCHNLPILNVWSRASAATGTNEPPL